MIPSLGFRNLVLSRDLGRGPAFLGKDPSVVSGTKTIFSYRFLHVAYSMSCNPIYRSNEFGTR